MKVLFVTNSLDMGGIETNLVRLARVLGTRGHDVLVASRPGALLASLNETGARHFPIEANIRRWAACRSDARRLRRLVETEAPDVVHSFSATASFLLRLALGRRGARRARGGPVVVSSVMGLLNSPKEARLRIHGRNWLTTLGADEVFVISPTIGQLLRRLPVRRSRLVDQAVVGVDLPDPGPLPPTEASSSRATLGATEGEKIVLTVGRLDPAKKHELFIDAARHVLLQRPRVTFAIVGGGPLRGHLEAAVRARGLEGRVHLVGEHRDVDRLLRVADVYVRPGGSIEGFVSITVLEAQALQVPVVSFASRDVGLAIRDGESGILVPQEDPALLARAVLELLADRERAQAIGRGGRAQVQAAFRLSAVVDGLLARYEELLRARAAARPVSPGSGAVVGAAMPEPHAPR